MSVLVTTPTGHVGRRVARRLREAGADFAVYARHPDKLDADLRERAVRGDLLDADGLAAALAGRDTLFLVVPPAFDAEDWPAHIRRAGEAAADAVRRAGTRRVVFLSSAGADRDDLGPVSGLGGVEALLRAAAPATVALRAGYFFENLFGSLDTLREGALYGGFPEDRAVAQVATQDIGDVAARWLLDPSWTGHHVAGVHGPADLTMPDVARQLTEALGRDVRYVPVPPEAVAGALRSAGASASVAEGYRAMVAGFARDARPAEPRTPETTTPTTLGDWAAAALRPALS